MAYVKVTNAGCQRNRHGMTVVWGDGVGIAASKQFTVCSFVRESTMTLTATTIPNFVRGTVILMTLLFDYLNVFE